MHALTLCLTLIVGAEPERITTDGRLKFDPVYLANGSEIVYALQETPAQVRLMKRTVDGTTTTLHPTAATSEFEPTFAANGERYAFVQSRGNLNLKLSIRDTKTGSEHAFDPGGGFASLRRPSMAPDGSRIVFSLPAGTGHTIVSVNAEGGDRKNLADGGLNHAPHFSADGKNIVFSSSREGTFDLHRMRADGSERHRLLTTPGADFRPQWSPDGKRIVFTSNQDGNYDLLLVDADGKNLRRLTTHEERDDYATWHPDGKSILFVGERQGKFDLYRLTVD